jgi:glycosyltransferase involved in cell wall biosynthesis
MMSKTNDDSWLERSLASPQHTPQRSFSTTSQTTQAITQPTSPSKARVPALDRSARPAHAALLVHSHLRWDFVWQRPQQIFSRLARSHPVLFTEEPMFDDGPARLAVTQPYPNLWRAIPMLPKDTLANVDDQWQAVLALLQDAVRRHPLLARRFDEPVQWFYSPMTAPHFLDRFNARCVVYDCMDELANFRFAPPDIRQRERFLLGRADVVFTGGYQLFEAKASHHDNVHFYGCGVDVEHYGKARLPATTVPPEVASLPRPVFGYFGVIDERIDYALIDRLATDFPQASVAMVGPVAKVDRSVLPDRPNIHWLGQRDYEDLPALVKGFDVCMMPFALNEATRFINPTKTLEYMAAGKPIVSTAVPDVLRHFTPIVEVAHAHDEFVDAIAQAHAAPCRELIERGLQRASLASWEAIVGAMRDHVLEALASSDGAGFEGLQAEGVEEAEEAEQAGGVDAATRRGVARPVAAGAGLPRNTSTAPVASPMRGGAAAGH